MSEANMAPYTRTTRETEHILREDKKMPVQLSSAQEIEGKTRPTERSEQVTNGGIVQIGKKDAKGRKSHRTAGRQLYRSRNPTPYQMPPYTAPMAVARKKREFRRNRCTTRPVAVAKEKQYGRHGEIANLTYLEYTQMEAVLG
jgi:hypothetical protein